MKCDMCQEISKFVCPCQFIPLCHNHVGHHMSETGHNCEQLSMSLDHSESQRLKNELEIRITKLGKSKRQVSSIAKKLIKEIKLFSKLALKNIEKYTRDYLKLLSFEKFSNSIISEIDKVLLTSLKTNKVFVDIKNILEENFTKDILKIVEKNQNEINEDENLKKSEKNNVDQYKIVDIIESNKSNDYDNFKSSEKNYLDQHAILDSKDEKHQSIQEKLNFIEENKDLVETFDSIKEEVSLLIEEEEKMVKTVFKLIEKEKIEEKSFFSLLRKGSSYQLLYEKQDFMESLNISDYQTYFAREGKYKYQVYEMKFSNDAKYSFICRIYKGIFK